MPGTKSFSVLIILFESSLEYISYPNQTTNKRNIDTVLDNDLSVKNSIHNLHAYEKLLSSFRPSLAY